MKEAAGERRVRVGICGFAERQALVYEQFKLLEVQRTFYQPPRLSTAAKWRQQAPADFVFTLKAWQLITHRAASPTYRRLRERLCQEELALAGDFQWNRVTQMAWERTLAVAEALNAAAIVFQTPASFRPNQGNLRQFRRFFATIRRGPQRLIFEPRGPGWTEDLLRSLLAASGVALGLDPFLRPPSGGEACYFRLHGRPAYHYQYSYTEEDLTALAAMADRCRSAWVLFNNVAMAADARRFQRRLQTRR